MDGGPPYHWLALAGLELLFTSKCQDTDAVSATRADNNASVLFQGPRNSRKAVLCRHIKASFRTLLVFLSFFSFRLKKKSIHHLCKYYITSPWPFSGESYLISLKRQNLLQNLMGNISRDSRPHQPCKNLRGRHARRLRAVALRPDHLCMNLSRCCLPAMWPQGKLFSISKPRFPYL